MICAKASSFRNVSHRKTRGSSRMIVQFHSKQCPVRSNTIGPGIEQSYWLILLFGSLNYLSLEIIKQVYLRILFIDVFYQIDVVCSDDRRNFL